MGLSFAVVYVLWRLLPVNHASTGALLTLQGLQAVGLFIVPSLVVAYLWSDQPLQWLHLVRISDGVLVLLSVSIMLTAIPLINTLVSWNEQMRLPEGLHGLEQIMQQMEEQADRLLQTFLTYRDGAWWVLLLNLFILAVLPAIGEELTFRGIIQSHLFNSRLSAFNCHLSIWLTAFIFSFVHFQFYGFFPRMLLGAVLGYALAWSGGIGYSVVMHATNNALSILVFYFGTYAWHLSPDEIDALGTEHTWWLTLVCTPVMFVLLFLFYARTRTIQK